MTDQPTVTDIRRGLVADADGLHKQAKPYSLAKKTDGAAFDAWWGAMLAANYANVIAATQRRIAIDHGEDYARDLAEIVIAAEDDGEDAYFANDDVRMAAEATQSTKTTNVGA